MGTPFAMARGWRPATAHLRSAREGADGGRRRRAASRSVRPSPPFSSLQLSGGTRHAQTGTTSRTSSGSIQTGVTSPPIIVTSLRDATPATRHRQPPSTPGLAPRPPSYPIPPSPFLISSHAPHHPPPTEAPNSITITPSRVSVSLTRPEFLENRTARGVGGAETLTLLQLPSRSIARECRVLALLQFSGRRGGGEGQTPSTLPKCALPSGHRGLCKGDEGSGRHHSCQLEGHCLRKHDITVSAGDNTNLSLSESGLPSGVCLLFTCFPSSPTEYW